MEGIAEIVRGFIINNFLFDSGDAVSLDNGASLLDQGIIDSTGVLELVEWIEERFGFSVADEDLIPENLGSVDNIDRFIEKNIDKTNG